MSLEQHRINISTLARRIRSGGAMNSSQELCGVSSFDELHEQLKPESYALAAVIGDRVITRAYSLKTARPPYGFVKDGEKWWMSDNIPLVPASFIPEETYTIAGPMRRTLFQSLAFEVADIKEGKALDPQLCTFL